MILFRSENPEVVAEKKSDQHKPKFGLRPEFSFAASPNHLFFKSTSPIDSGWSILAGIEQLIKLKDKTSAEEISLEGKNKTYTKRPF